MGRKGSWSGRAELLGEDGQGLAMGMAQLISQQSAGGRVSWEGELLPDRLFTHANIGEFTLRLHDGRAGRVLISNVRIASSGAGVRQVVELAGQAEPPF